MSVAEICHMLLREKVEPALGIVRKGLDEEGKTLEDDEMAGILEYGLHTLRSVGMGYCVFGDYDKAHDVLDALKEQNKIYEEQIRASGDEGLITLLEVPVDKLKEAITATKEMLPAFFQRLGYDPDFMKKYAAQKQLDPEKDEMTFDREGYKVLVDKHLERAGVNGPYIGLLGEYLTDGAVLAAVDIKKSENRIKPRTLVMGITCNPYGYPTIEGAHEGFASVDGLEGATMGAMGAVDLYGRFPSGEFIGSMNIRSKGTADMVKNFSFEIANRAAGLAVAAGRNKAEEADVVKAYDQLAGPERDEVHAKYRETKVFGAVLESVMKEHDGNLVDALQAMFPEGR